MKNISISPVTYCLVCFLILALLVKGVRSENALQQINASRTPKPTLQVYSSTKHTVQANETIDIVTNDIVRTSDKGDYKTGLVSHSDTYYQYSEKGSDIVKYGDYLLQVDMTRYPTELVGDWGTDRSDFYQKNIKAQTLGVNVYNVNSGEKFTIRFEKPVNIDGLEYAGGSIVDDTYYFGFGGELGTKLKYKVALPPTTSTKIVELSSPLGRWLHKQGNYHYTADCYEGCFYKLFYPDTQKTTTLKRLNDTNRFSSTERLEGFDANGNYILKLGDISKSPDTQEKFETRSIVLVDPSTEHEIETLLTTDSFKEKAFSYYSLANSQTAIVFGANIYLYNVNLRSLFEAESDDVTRKILLNNNYIQFFPNSNLPEHTYCVHIYSNQNPGNYYLTVTGNKVSVKESQYSCEYDNQNIITSLNMGDKHKIVESKHSYPVLVTQRNTPENDIPEGFTIVK